MFTQEFGVGLQLVEYVTATDLVATLAEERLVPDDVAWKRCMCLRTCIHWLCIFMAVFLHCRGMQACDISFDAYVCLTRAMQGRR